MAVTISDTFVISWGTDGIVHILDNQVGSIKLGPYVIRIDHTMITFDAAVNPYVYALINERFLEKMKKMICCIQLLLLQGLHRQGNNKTSRWRTTLATSRATKQEQLPQSNALELKPPSNFFFNYFIGT